MEIPGSFLQSMFFKARNSILHFCSNLQSETCPGAAGGGGGSGVGTGPSWFRFGDKHSEHVSSYFVIVTAPDRLEF